MRLQVDEDELASCVSCGLCLPHCPTYRVSGDESRSPRGRIAAMRAVHSGAVEAGPSFARVIDECVLCRGCEPACPSGVPFGRLMEGTRRTLAEENPRSVSVWKRAGYGILARHRVLLVLSTVAALIQRVGLVPRRLGLPRMPVRRSPLQSTGDDVWVYPGCVMDAWMRPVHQAVIDVAARMGAGVALPGRGGDCCGALHGHAGLGAEARRLARRVIASMPGDAPVLVDSAGCGAALKDYGELLGTREAEEFAARVRDVHEWLASRADDLPAGRLRYPVAVQDPCHLRHAQGAHGSVREVLSRYAELVELDDEGLCCGAGGAYAVQHPGLAGDIRDRKVAAIRRSGVDVVASANPGCMMHLSAAGVDARHPMELVAEAIGEGGPQDGR